ncbi:hypothetical protein DL89DRAFT_84074 [Linderina pennispora]|uniref:Uncharacterized protein n=1 Tax=Linderina pennispora TaxID=61395 RepID=A0A1Y1WH25_9FUNG|nr:uncharacterized protein DL89DRAFT_84074 [Linderina pennispora]ORX72871.1 hypothetical protein DL89DRAFT_84074 [Linderina pennispora]
MPKPGRWSHGPMPANPTCHCRFSFFFFVALMAASYYIEVLDNLGLVDIYVKLDQHVHQSDILLVDDSTLRLNIATTLVLPASVNAARATTSTLPAKNGSSWLRMRAPISRSTNHLQHLKSAVPLSQIDGPISADSVRGFTAICCRSCRSQLTHSARDVVVRDLPSTYWSELVECWVCHPEEDKLRINPDLLHLFEPDTGKVACQEAESKGG